MGLRIYAYRKLKIIENPILDEEGNPVDKNNQWLPGAGMDWSESHWPGRGAGIESNKVYTFDECWDFSAGSYTGYNFYRNALKKFAKGSSAFEEQIQFADNEGVIGPIVSAKLANDYQDNYEKAIKFAESHKLPDWWIERYRDWMEAFLTASDSGAVNYR